MMKFHQMRLKNFMPFIGTDHEISFPTDDHTNILLIHGPNTYGKTSILMAIKWGLYGRVYKRNRQLDFLDILNKTSSKNKDFEFEVSINFEANGNKYEITRSVSKKSDVTTPRRDEDFKLESYLTKNGDVLPGADIEHEISLIAPEPVSRFFLFDGELLDEYEELLSEDSDVGSQIKTSIEQILGVPALINGKLDTSELVKDYEKKQNKELKKSGAINSYVKARTAAQEEIKRINIEIERLNKQSAEVNSKKDEVKESIKNIEEKFEAAKELEKTRDKIKALKSEIETLEQEHLKAASKAWKVLLKPKLFEVQKESLTNLDKIIIQFQKVGALTKELELLDIVLTKDNCEICDTDDGNGFNKPSIEKKKKSIEEEIEKTKLDRNHFSKISTQHEVIQSLLEDTEDRSLTSIYNELSNKNVERSKEESHEEELKKKSGITDTAEIIAANQKIGGYDQRLKQIEKDINDQKEKIDKFEKQIIELSGFISNDPGSGNSPTTRYVSVYNTLHELFSDSIINLRDKLKDEVEKKASEAFTQIIHRDYKGLKINNNYGLQIINKDNNLVHMKSAGAAQIVALSLIDALSRTGRSSGPVVMDTPFARLDPDHRINILEYLPKTASQLILFVHKGEIDNKILKLIAGKIGGEYQLKLQSDTINSELESIH